MMMIMSFHKKVLDTLLSWLNQFLSDSRVRLTSLEDDLKACVPIISNLYSISLCYVKSHILIFKDGMVLKLVLEKLTGQEVRLIY